MTPTPVLSSDTISLSRKQFWTLLNAAITWLSVNPHHSNRENVDKVVCEILNRLRQGVSPAGDSQPPSAPS